MSDEIDEIVEQLKADNVPGIRASANTTPSEVVTDANVEAFIYDKAAKLIEMSMGAALDLKESVISGGEAKEIAALASLFGAATKAIETLNKLNLQKKDAVIQKELKAMELEASKNIGKNMLENTKGNNTTNIVITTREKILDQISGKITDALPKRRENIKEAEIIPNNLLESGE
jgi:hypothetical protein